MNENRVRTICSIRSKKVLEKAYHSEEMKIVNIFNVKKENHKEVKREVKQAVRKMQGDIVSLKKLLSDNINNFNVKKKKN